MYEKRLMFIEQLERHTALNFHLSNDPSFEEAEAHGELALTVALEAEQMLKHQKPEISLWYSCTFGLFQGS